MSRYFARTEEQGKDTMRGLQVKPTPVEEVSLSEVQTGSIAVDSSDKDGHKNSTPRVCLYVAVAIILSGVVVTTGLVVSGRIPGHASPESGKNDVAMSVKAPRHSDAESTKSDKNSKNKRKKASNEGSRQETTGAEFSGSDKNESSEAESDSDKDSRGVCRKPFLKHQRKKKRRNQPVAAVSTATNKHPTKEGNGKEDATTGAGNAKSREMRDRTSNQTGKTVGSGKKNQQGSDTEDLGSQNIPKSSAEATSSSDKTTSYALTAMEKIFAVWTSASILIGGTWFANWWSTVGSKSGSVVISESAPPTDPAAIAKDPGSVARGNVATNRDDAIVGPVATTGFSDDAHSVAIGSSAAVSSVAAVHPTNNDMAGGPVTIVNPPSFTPAIVRNFATSAAPVLSANSADPRPSFASNNQHRETTPQHQEATPRKRLGQQGYARQLKQDRLNNMNKSELILRSAFEHLTHGPQSDVVKLIMKKERLSYTREEAFAKFIEEIFSMPRIPVEGEGEQRKQQLFDALKTLNVTLGEPSELHALAVLSDMFLENGYFFESAIIGEPRSIPDTVTLRFHEEIDYPELRAHISPEAVLPRLLKAMKRDAAKPEIRADEDKVCSWRLVFPDQPQSKYGTPYRELTISCSWITESQAFLIDVDSGDDGHYGIPKSISVQLRFELWHFARHPVYVRPDIRKQAFAEFYEKTLGISVHKGPRLQTGTLRPGASRPIIIPEGDAARGSLQLLKAVQTLATKLGKPSEISALVALSDTLEDRGLLTGVSIETNCPSNKPVKIYIPIPAVLSQVVKRMEDDNIDGGSLYVDQIRFKDYGYDVECVWIIHIRDGNRVKDQIYVAAYLNTKRGKFSISVRSPKLEKIYAIPPDTVTYMWFDFSDLSDPLGHADIAGVSAPGNFNQSEFGPNAMAGIYNSGMMYEARDRQLQRLMPTNNSSDPSFRLDQFAAIPGYIVDAESTEAAFRRYIHGIQNVPSFYPDTGPPQVPNHIEQPYDDGQSEIFLRHLTSLANALRKRSSLHALVALADKMIKDGLHLSEDDLLWFRWDDSYPEMIQDPTRLFMFFEGPRPAIMVLSEVVNRIDQNYSPSDLHRSEDIDPVEAITDPEREFIVHETDRSGREFRQERFARPQAMCKWKYCSLPDGLGCVYVWALWEPVDRLFTILITSGIEPLQELVFRVP